MIQQQNGNTQALKLKDIEQGLIKVFTLSNDQLRPKPVADAFGVQYKTKPEGTNDYAFSDQIDPEWRYSFSVAPEPQKLDFDFNIFAHPNKGIDIAKAPCIEYAKFKEQMMATGWKLDGKIPDLLPQRMPNPAEKAGDVKSDPFAGWDVSRGDYYVKGVLFATVYLRRVDLNNVSVACLERIAIKPMLGNYNR